ncbi:MAG: HDOD domain-containing protein [Pseudomonadota bacterium]
MTSKASGRNSNPVRVFAGHLCGHEIPGFADRVLAISRLSGGDSASIPTLLRTILADPAMTAGVLHAAGRAYFNPSGHSISTVNQAITQLGFATVQRLAVSAGFLDQFLRGPRRERLRGELALCLHIACQAHRLAAHFTDHDPDEIYTSALLARIGVLAFWASREERATQLATLEQRPGMTAEHAEREVLGFTLNDLTAQLNRDWRVSPLLEMLLDGTAVAHTRARYLYHGYRLAQALMAGTTQPATAIAEAAQSLAISREELALLARQAAEESCELCRMSRDEILSRAIPSEAVLASLGV